MMKRVEPSDAGGGRALAKPRSVRAVGRVSRIIGFTLGFGWVLLGSAGAIGAGAEPIELVQWPTVAYLLPGVLLAARATMIGVKIEGSTLKIVSWWRNYRIEADQVPELLVRYYSGYLNRWSDSDVMVRHTKVLGVERGGVDRFFPATAMTNTAAERVIPEIARALGVRFEDVP